AALAECGVDRVCIARFDASLASLAPERFVDEILVRDLCTRYLLIGDDFRFGARRAGDFALLRRMAPAAGFALERPETVQPARAAALLGRPYSICGRVLHGRKLGRTLGFPTLNVRIPFERPAVAGVFVVRAHGLRDTPVEGVASLGTRPAVERDGRLLLEVHLFDFNGPAYGRLVSVECVAKLRDERDFGSLDELRAQIDRDARDARAHFAAARAAAAAPANPNPDGEG